ncbi:hypothetical protein Q31a_04180 [Aureliella helgolandensis]|uniref:Uncharacterized protein n=1 Tax=Aureliella helgolandensis TaxID=2527968 RepID=A0A518G0K5_9BACT|nr:hypothetical protein Q31a_04180 [Aureliella helgolandensis]
MPLLPPILVNIPAGINVNHISRPADLSPPCGMFCFSLAGIALVGKDDPMPSLRTLLVPIWNLMRLKGRGMGGKCRWYPGIPRTKSG